MIMGTNECEGCYFVIGGKRDKKRDILCVVCVVCCVLCMLRAVCCACCVCRVLLLTQTSFAAFFLIIATPFIVRNITLPMKSKDIHLMAEHLVQYHDNWNETT